MTRITNRQIGLIIFISTIALKFSVKPSIMCKYSGSDIYLAIIVDMLMELFMFLVVLYFVLKHPDKDFYHYLKDSFGVVVSKTIFILMFFYFLIKTLLTVQEIYIYFLETLFDNFNTISFIVPLFLLLSYMLSKELFVFARSVEILFWFIIVGIIVVMLVPINNVELINYFPILENGIGNLFMGIEKTSFGGGDYLILLIFMKYIDKDDKKSPLIASVLLAIWVVVSFYFVFIGVFGETGVNQLLAISDISLHNAYPSSIGRLDWLTIIIWTTTLTLQMGFTGYICMYLLRNIVDINKTKSIVIIDVLLIVLFLIGNNYFTVFFEIIMSTPFLIYVGVLHYLLPLVLLINHFIRGRRVYEKSS
ncbi:MAG: GerAB/ArcD/ProY family transporter [Clostridia bacterium]|nr:GerAB/ArcD/ProY family transporter [Clostridia bacterium]